MRFRAPLIFNYRPKVLADVCTLHWRQMRAVSNLNMMLDGAQKTLRARAPEKKPQKPQKLDWTIELLKGKQVNTCGLESACARTPVCLLTTINTVFIVSEESRLELKLCSAASLRFGSASKKPEMPATETATETGTQTQSSTETDYWCYYWQLGRLFCSAWLNLEQSHTCFMIRLLFLVPDDCCRYFTDRPRWRLFEDSNNNNNNN